MGSAGSAVSAVIKESFVPRRILCLLLMTICAGCSTDPSHQAAPPDAATQAVADRALLEQLETTARAASRCGTIAVGRSSHGSARAIAVSMRPKTYWCNGQTPYQ